MSCGRFFCEHSMQIPWQSLSDTALTGVIQEFVLREGTEYGPSDVSLARKVEQVLAQIQGGRVGIFYDPDAGTTTLQELET
jgi:uncharacterized protein YheU (UPF0270 family)